MSELPPQLRPVRPRAVLTEEELATSMQKVREELCNRTLEALRLQLAHEIQSRRLLYNINDDEHVAEQVAFTAAAVTAAQLLADRINVAFSREIERIDAAFNAVSEVMPELTERMNRAIATLEDSIKLDESYRQRIAALEKQVAELSTTQVTVSKITVESDDPDKFAAAMEKTP